jgi:hypothetical protein
MACLLQAPERHELDEVSNVEAGRRAVEADIGGYPLLKEQGVQVLRRRAVMIGAALHEDAEKL